MKYITAEKILIDFEGNESNGNFGIDYIIGCSHDCKYPCWAMNKFLDLNLIKNEEEWTEVKLIKNSIELLNEEIKKYKNVLKSVFLCHHTDPFMYGEKYKEISKLSYEIIKLLNDSDIECTILTKGILPIELSNLSKINKFGITISTLNEDVCKKIEPFASPLTERLAALYDLHKAGMRTWVSLKPYLTPNIVKQEINDILDAVRFVNTIVFGGNYLDARRRATEYDDFYKKNALKVLEFCEANGKGYYIEKGLLSENALIKSIVDFDWGTSF